MSRIKQRIIFTIAALVALFGIATVAAAPANASFANCPNGQSCMYSGEWGTGTQVNFAWSSYHDGQCHTLTLKPVGGYHSAHGGYGSPYVFNIYSGTNCTGYLDGLAAFEDWDSPSITVNSIRITP